MRMGGSKGKRPVLTRGSGVKKSFTDEIVGPEACGLERKWRN